MGDHFRQTILQDLLQDEGYRQFPYKDSVGKLTIGIGRNIDDRGISKEEALYLATNDINECIKELKQSFPFYDSLSQVRQMVLINMAFNLGISKLMQFRNMREAIERGDFKYAAEHMLDSKWAKQVGNRAERLALKMEMG